ncbi:MAG: hypothetical protein P8J86_04515 [Phycisphaerales bacterium]|nr:hypothetical protein [Phycisphaerales bacterium]
MRIDSAMPYIPKYTTDKAHGPGNNQPDAALRSGTPINGKLLNSILMDSGGNISAPRRSHQTQPSPTPPNNNMPQLSMDGMIAAFGTNDAAYDLNADGIVDLDDFSQFLINGATGFHPDGAITAEGIEANLGSNNLAYDLDGDGSVGLSDFTEFLVNYGQNTQNSQNAPDNSVIRQELYTKPHDNSVIRQELYTKNNNFGNQTSSIAQLTDGPMSIRGSSLFGKQAIQLYQQLWNHSGNMPPRQLLSGA